MMTIDRIVLAAITASALFAFSLMSYELGQASMCEKDADYVWQIDFGKCVKIGKGGYK